MLATPKVLGNFGAFLFLIGGRLSNDMQGARGIDGLGQFINALSLFSGSPTFFWGL